MKRFVNIAVLAVLIFLQGCAADSGRVTEYLAGFPFDPAASAQPQKSGAPLVAGLVLALPETESGKPTTPSPAILEKVAGRIQKELQESSGITVQRVFSPITVPAGGLSLERLRNMVKESNLERVIVVVATSRVAHKIRFTTVLETQLYASMDAALIEVPSGRILLTESGQDDYVMADVLDYTAHITFPRLYYRNFTFGGPFIIVEGDPYQALGWETFKGAADQLGMKLRQRLSLAGVS